MRKPELLQRLFYVELPAQGVLKAVEPLLLGQVLTDCSEVQYRARNSILAQSRGRADHEAGFAHLSRGKDITEPAVEQAVEQLGVGPAHDVGGRIARKRSACYVERPSR